MAKASNGRVPSATVSRIVTYVRVLSELEREGVATINSEVLARRAHVSAFQVRKDLAYFGSFGTRGAGYEVHSLLHELEGVLGLARPWNVAIVGMGRLGQALADYPNLVAGHYRLVAAFDADPVKVGAAVAGIRIQGMEELERSVRDLRVHIALLTVPQGAAQDVANSLVAAGVNGILNFAPTVVEAPPGTFVEPVDFLAGLSRLSYYIRSSIHEEELR